MTLNTPKPDSFTDASFLEFVIALWTIEHLGQNLDAEKTIADLIDRSVPHLTDCLSGKSRLGIDEWTKIVAHSGIIAEGQFKKYLAICERKNRR